MSTLSFGSVDNVALTYKKPPNDRERELIRLNLERLSSILAARYPTLRPRWLASEPDSLLRSLVARMVEAAASKVSMAAGGSVASETIGPYGYSTFDSADPGKGLFLREEILALEGLLRQEAVKKRRTAVVSHYLVTEAKPMLYPGMRAPGNEGWYYPC